MILSHRIGLVLLDRKNQDPSARRHAYPRFGASNGTVSRRLDKLAALAARLTRLGSRDLPLPARLQRLDLPPVPRAVADAMAWSAIDPAPTSSPQAMAPVSLPSSRDVPASLPAPTRAVTAAISGTRTGGAHPSVRGADQEKRRVRNTSMIVSAASVLPKRDAARPASEPRPSPAAAGAALSTSRPVSPLAVVRTAVAGGGGGRSTRSRQDREPGTSGRSVALQAADRAAGGGKTLSLITSRSTSRGAPADDRLDPGRRAGMEIRYAVPGAVRRDAAGGPASSSATRILPLEAPVSGSTSEAQHRLAVLQRSVVSPPRTSLRQDVLRRQVVPPACTPGRSTTSSNSGVTQGDAGSRQAAGQGAVAEGGLDMEAGKVMMVSLTGDVVIDGRRLGQVAASSQASQASLPAHGPSRVNLRAVPIHSGMQIPQ